MFRSIRLFACAAVLSVLPLGVANAGHYGHHHAPHCHYKKVVDYVTQYETRTKWITICDDYGCHKRVPRTYTVPVQVPVVRWVKVCH